MINLYSPKSDSNSTCCRALLYIKQKRNSVNDQEKIIIEYETYFYQRPLLNENLTHNIYLFDPHKELELKPDFIISINSYRGMQESRQFRTYQKSILNGAETFEILSMLYPGNLI